MPGDAPASSRSGNGDDRDTCETGHGLMFDVPSRGLTYGGLPQWSVVRWLSASALSCSVGKLYCRVVSRRECPMSSATTTRPVLPRTRLVANVCLRTWAVGSSSSAACSAMAAMMPPAARADRRPPLVLGDRPSTGSDQIPAMETTDGSDELPEKNRSWHL